MDPLLRAHTALALLAIDPALGGLVVRSRAGPVREAVMATVPTHTRLHPAMGAETLEGGVDVSATLSTGTLTQTRGLLSQKGTFVLAMAERCTPYLGARLAAMLDRGQDQTLIALDEGIEDECLPAALSDRLAFSVSLEDCALADIAPTPTWPCAIALDRYTASTQTIETLTTLAAELGILSLRAPSAAVRTAAAHAALNGRSEPSDEDFAAAVALVYAHRATRRPAQDEAETAPPNEPPQPDNTQETAPKTEDAIPQDILLDAVLAALPPDVLAKLNTGATSRSAAGGGAGHKKIGNRRGRPLPARDGGSAQGRVDLIATLRAAVPWQTLRRASAPDRTGPIIRHSDLRRKCYLDLSDRLLIFTVDASGSAAMARMGEAKGAIELLLAEAYARRDHVALISFRGTEAETLLPPTRSLVQTKRRLSALPGGGGTPLAAGLQSAAMLALQSRAKGLSPTLVVLTDGRANIALDGTSNRATAATDAENVARMLRGQGLDALVIDMSNRPQAPLEALSATLGATYTALPRANAQKLSEAVTAALSDG